MKKYDVIINHKGIIDLEVIDDILLKLKNYLHENKIELVIRKRVYTLAVESLDNIYKHADHSIHIQKIISEFPPRFIVEKICDDFVIHTGNIILESNKEKIISKLERINTLSQEEIIQLYKKSLSHAEISDKGGAGLGLIVMAKTTAQKIKYDFDKINDKFFYFAMQLTIKK
ncbi:MAG: hypothetical protein A2X13_01890 [Bacteroidetes bacterium GWC2_33_15]|nr:MAG: hypothetical protein A2X10_07735 [Bacteroidetes bacterium GWA2_33_15]OFX52231.1 MAG: hypothetical protein A2X13_01890 [Bacteroidetes bacterium GWC2_33_15]OFX64385.1 MAG: hypothetical protein A2X15_12710 [Bacteroidetes bacterium GWB2_32_14]OFX67790.1 MAG: hypothetical protein A2X14_06535 [Bacteroidetes bacterium GWD2_33_33]HAN19402.1 hypothetical protein [Bacteroidales bacterium]